MDDKQLLDDIEKLQYNKSKLDEISKKHGIGKFELDRFYRIKFFQEISDLIDLDKISTHNIEYIESLVPKELESKFKFIKSDFAKILKKSLYIATRNGFISNINEIESGIMTANAGDSAEFIFVARAILAGFNCSSVDVRSSKYDVIIDYDDTLLRVQIKGISTGNNISFKDRDRGGQGIDHKHERNIGKRITSADCDIYVAVDKQVGICYIIPMYWADKLSDIECKAVKLQDAEEFKENWDIIKIKAKTKAKTKG